MMARHSAGRGETLQEALGGKRMPCGFKADLPGNCSKAEKSEEGDVFGKLNHAPGDHGWIEWTFRPIQLFPCDVRDSLSTQSRPEPLTLKCKPQSSGLQWG